MVFAFFLGLAEGFDQQVTEVLNGNRQAVYGRVAGISGTLMGFGIAVAAFIIPSVMSSERFRLLRVNENFDNLWRTYSQVVKSFGLLTVSSLVCLIVDTDSSPYLWSLVKRGISGVNHAVSKKYLQNYLNEYSFRYNRRNQEQPLFEACLGQMVKQAW